MWKTTDLCDEFENELQICRQSFRSFGKKEQFHGKIATVKVKDDNVLVKEGLQTLPEGTVLVVDGEPLRIVRYLVIIWQLLRRKESWQELL